MNDNIGGKATCPLINKGNNMQCKKCDYETSEKYYDDNGNEFLADHYCYDNKYYNSETEKYEDDDIVVIIGDH